MLVCEGPHGRAQPRTPSSGSASGGVAVAFVVCYSWSPPDDHTRHGAIYLNQQFYELIFSTCRSEHSPYLVLREIALLKYKSPTLVVAGNRLELLDRELARLEESGAAHPQIAEFRRVCAKAISDGCSLTISGDMYPELWKMQASPGAAADRRPMGCSEGSAAVGGGGECRGGSTMSRTGCGPLAGLLLTAGLIGCHREAGPNAPPAGDGLPAAPTESFLGSKAGDEREVAGVKLCWCPAGRFLMGSPPSEPERRPGEAQVEVTLSKGFWMGKYEATQGQWKRVIGKLPGELT